MLPLKIYQERVIEELQNYLKLCTSYGAERAFFECTERNYVGIKQLPGLPYVCLRVPTGGGKTLIASHSIASIRKEYLYTDYSTVLWIVPTNKIKEQTLDALKDKNHPYRLVIESQNNGELHVLDLQEAIFTGVAEYNKSTTIIVTTLAALRIEDTNGRKIYESNGHLLNHFTDITREQKNNLEKGDSSEILYSLANVLRLRRPIIIMDEAHNARTELSFDSLARFNPSAIIEYTATPQQIHDPDKHLYSSNILYSVSAAELKAEWMIKMPIYLETNVDWHEILNKSILKRSQLEKITEREEVKEYIRPILLIQAQAKSKQRKTITVEVIKKTLMNDFKIPEKEIKIQTGEAREIDGLDLFDDSCEVRYIITVQALKEGWDCSFAYVLCSISDVGSSTAAEQFIGRILRLPNATKKEQEELNSAYAYVVSNQFHQTLAELGNGLIENGFSEFEAKSIIKEASKQTGFLEAPVVHTVKVTSVPDLTNISPRLEEVITYQSRTQEIKLKGFIDESEKIQIQDCFSDDNDKNTIEDIYNDIILRFKTITEKEKGVFKKPEDKFEVPLLLIKNEDQLQVFEDIHFINTNWDILKYDTNLDGTLFDKIEDNSKAGKIALDKKGNVEYRFIEELHDQLSLLVIDKDWTVEELVYWLDRNIMHQDISQSKFVTFVSNIITDLIEVQKVDFNKVLYYKYKLRDKIVYLINEYRIKAHSEKYKEILESEKIVIDENITVNFNPDIYPTNTIYTGNYKFNKHYYPNIGELKDSGEEFDCAVYIDSLPEVKYWVRNLERQPVYSFWLQTSTDKFYPDFVALLNNGRVLVIEYKGKPWSETKDSEEKEALGNIWAKKSGGKGLFIMATKDNLDDIKSMIINTK